MSPVNGGDIVELELKPSIFEVNHISVNYVEFYNLKFVASNYKIFQNGKVYKFAMVAVDDSNNKSPLSGFAELRDICPPSKVNDLKVFNWFMFIVTSSKVKLEINQWDYTLLVLSNNTKTSYLD